MIGRSAHDHTGSVNWPSLDFWFATPKSEWRSIRRGVVGGNAMSKRIRGRFYGSGLSRSLI